MQASRLKLVKQALFAFGVLLTVVIAGGCASPVPGQAGRSSKRLIVTMTFNGAMNPGLYYYFVINYAKDATGAGPGNQNARGPVAVLGASTTIGGFGNGFATGSPPTGAGSTGGPTDNGLTDFVVYHSGQANGDIGVYHFPGDPNIPNTFIYEGLPASFVLPDLNNPTDIAGATTLTFQLPLSQLAIDPATNQPYSNPTKLAQVVSAMQWLQVNIVATNIVPTDQAAHPDKEVDAFGNTLSSRDQSSFLTIDLSQNRTYTSTDTTTLLTPEPPNDVYPCGNCNDAIDLTSWSIQVVNTGG